MDLKSITSGSTVPSILAATIGVAEKALDIRAVDEQARSLLRTANQVSGQLRHAKALRRQKSDLFTSREKQMFNDTFCSTEDAIRELADLAERTRADMDVSGKVRLATRILFIFRDSPRVSVTLAQLVIANQNLSRDLGIMCNREGTIHDLPRFEQSGDVSSTISIPPTYEETMFITEQRQKNVRRRNGARSLYDQSATSSLVSLPSQSPSNGPNIAELSAEVRPLEMSSDLSPVYITNSRPCLFASFAQISTPSLSFEGSGTLERHRSGRQRSMLWLETHSR